MSRPIKQSSGGRTSSSPAARNFGTSYRSQHENSIAAIAEESIARDLEDGDEEIETGGADPAADDRFPHHDPADILGQHSMAGNYRRPSYIAGAPRPFLGTQPPETIVPLEQDVEAAIAEERSLLRDNRIIPPKHPRRRDSQASVASSSAKGLRRILSITAIGRRRSVMPDEEDEIAAVAAGRDEPTAATETTALLGGPAGNDPDAPYGGQDTPENIAKKWEEAVVNGQIQTSWQRELKVLAKYSAPLMLTYVLQNSLTLTSIFTVGHIGKIELGAVSLGSMTANITGYAVYHGLATSLDTLCAQAYGSGKKKLVGLQLQRMVYFLWTCTIPIAIIWALGTQILAAIVPETEIAILAGQYLKVLICGAPGYALFEAGKRYVQAQGKFEATLYVLLIAAPLNVLLHYLFVWQFKWGFIGCPIAVAITETVMPLLLFLYVRFFCGPECWPGFTTKALRNWGPMIRLALPGLIMVLAEFLAFEILNLASARISATHLAANTVLQAASLLTYQIPFPLSIAASTRVANLIGASLPDAAKTTAQVTFVLGTVIGIMNVVLISSLRYQIPWLFSSEADVVELAAAVLPINAAFQLFDALAAVCNGMLRGLGKQEFGGYISLIAYYLIALPISFGLCFGLHQDLAGLWIGPAIGLAVIAVVEGIYLYRTSYEKASEEARKRNAE